MSPEEVRVGRKIRVGKRHRIEERRGMVGTVVGRYGGEGYVRRSSNSLGMGRRRARPPKQAVVGPWCSWINSTVRHYRRYFLKRVRISSATGSILFLASIRVAALAVTRS
jgi:hypothetical protein